MPDDLDDYGLDEEREGEEPWTPAPQRDRFVFGLVAAAVVLVLGAGAAFYFLVLRKPKPEPPTPRPAVVAPPTATPTPAASLPPLDQSDAFVRELLGGLSSHGQLASWLATEGLVRRGVEALTAVADGSSPAAYLRFMGPQAPFSVIERRGKVYADPKAYARYDVVADVIESLDTAACASAFERLEPLLQHGLSELGARETVRARLARAIGVLGATPVPQGDPELRPVERATTVYEYADPRLEALRPAPKHLLRMGPDNARRVQAKLRELSDALGLQATAAAPAPPSPEPGR
jgi:hypothetical protein